MFDWSDIPVFLALVEEGSALAAARRLDLNQTTVSRRIENLEKSLGICLFAKSPRGYRLTRDGLLLVDIAENMAEAARELDYKASSMNRSLSGTIRFSGNETTMRIYGMPLMARFRAVHPDVHFEVDTQNREVSLEKGEADIAMRSADRVMGDTLVARKFDVQPWAIYCSRDYAARCGGPTGFEDSAMHPLVNYSAHLTGQIRCLTWLAKQMPDNPVALQVDTTLGMTSALRSGIGIGALPRVMADENPELIYCFGHARLTHAIWIVASQESYSMPMVRSFLRFFREHFEEVRVVYTD